MARLGRPRRRPTLADQTPRIERPPALLTEVNSFQRIANTLVAPPLDFPLEHRLFHFVALLNAVSGTGFLGRYVIGR